MSRKSAIVVGAGIVGLATARALAERGYDVSVFEKTERAVGASIRNFGMIWPIGQPAGKLYERALISRNIWEELCEDAGIWYSAKGSMHVVYEDDEWDTLQEFADLNCPERDCRLVNADEVARLSPAVNTAGLKGGLFSSDEIIIDSRQAIATLPAYMAEKYGIRFHFSTMITNIQYPYVFAGNTKYQADELYVCGGQEFESLYPDLYSSFPVTRCKLQMMRSSPQPDGYSMGPALCGGLTLLHYGAFKECPSLDKVMLRTKEQYPEHVKWGIHVMVCQNGLNELVIGDSHEYGFTHDPFDKKEINMLILDYLKRFATFPDLSIAQSWNGTYLKMKEGTELVIQPEAGVTIVNGLGGAGMTFSFGLMEEVISGKYKTVSARGAMPLVKENS